MNIVLTGFMGTGKTAIGKHLARSLGMRYIDTDRIIEKKENCSISKIFAEKGEKYFRELETRIIRDVSSFNGYVISTGGGAILRKENADALRKNGYLVCLKADPDTILDRIGDGEGRPLLRGFANKKLRIQQLLKKREPFYRQADIMIDTSSLSISRVVEELVKLLSAETLQVRLDKNGYPVFVGLTIDNIGKIARDFKLGKKVLIISDRNVFPLYGERVRYSLEQCGFKTFFFQVPPGERSKSLTWVRKIYSFCLECSLDRSSSILALGGGVVGDLAGFVAATFLRGINLLMIPTTLLSQVDSGVGGKVGVNLPQGKNLVGAFYQPKFVLIDPVVLRTLSLKRLKEGIAEVVKCAIIKDKDFFSYLEKNIQRILDKNLFVLRSVIIRAVRIKIGVVEKDEKEKIGIRQILNFGHTIAHAIETVAGYRRYTHGDAVAIGIIGASKLGVKLGIFPQESFARVEKLLKMAKLPLKGKNLDTQQIIQALKKDKKVREGKVLFVIPEEIGRVSLKDDIPVNLVKQVIEELVV